MVCSVVVMCITEAKGNDVIQVTEADPFDFLTLVLVIASISIGIWFVKSGRNLLPPRDYSDNTITPIMATFLCAMIFLLSGIGGWLGGWWGAGRIAQSTIEQHAWISASAVIATIPVLIVYMALRHRYRSRHVIAAVVTTFVVFVPMTLAVAEIGHKAFTTIGLEPLAKFGHTTLDDLAASSWGTSAWIVVICATIGAGIIEEILYRGLMLPLLASLIGGRTAWRAIITTSILFALMHAGSVPPSAMIGLFVFAIGLGWARIVSRGVVAPIAIHILFNAMNIAFVYSTKL